MNLRDKIFGAKKHQEFREIEIVYLHDALMAEYGWIPIKEFRELPIPTLLNLVEAIRRRRELEKKEMGKGKKKL